MTGVVASSGRADERRKANLVSCVSLEVGCGCCPWFMVLVFWFVLNSEREERRLTR